MIWVRSLLVGLGFGALVGLFMCYIALDHNPQGEFANPETGAYTSDLYRLFAVYMVLVGLPVAALVALIGFLRRRSD